MGYNPSKGKESTQLPPDTVLVGRITAIKDGKVSDFVKNTEAWQGSIEQPAINVSVDVENEGAKVEMNQVFTYSGTDADGNTLYPPKSNMGKFKKKYERLPEVGMVVKVATSAEGFGKIKLE